MTHESAVRTWAPAVETGWKVTVVEPTTSEITDFGGLDDAALVAACVAGRREAFDVIVERHRRTVYQVCYRFVGNHEDASDLSQEAFVRAWRGLKNFKGQSALSTWLYRIAVTLILRTYHDMSHQQIADVLGSSVGAVKANFFHALANLKKILGSEP
jgi:DNA-directed RNA polymerase specialized sigma24 family protein